MDRNWQWALAATFAATIAVAAGLGVGAAPQGRRIEIVAQANASMDPEAFWVDPGEQVTVTFTNADLFGSHNIVFELDAGRIVSIDPIGFARSEELSFTAPATIAGYPYYSSVGNDRERGFEGVLYVGDEPTVTPLPSPTGGGSPTRTRTPTLSPTPPRTATATLTPSGEPPETVVTGLHNPRGLTALGDGTLLVAEGGTGNPVPGTFAPGNGDGRVQRISLDDPTQRDTIADELTNAIRPDAGIMGANHAIWWDRPDGATGTARVVLIAVAGGPGHARPDDAAKIVEVGAGGGTVLADPLAFETANNPDGGAVDSNPWRLIPGTLAPGVATIFVVDAGANAILAMDPDTGALTTYAVFPSVDDAGEIQAVPSGLALHPNDSRAAFVSLLGGGRPGEGQVRRLEDSNGDGDALDPNENALWVDGLSAPTDLAFAPAGPMTGRLFVIEMSAGRVMLVDAQGMAPIEVARSLRGCSGMAFEATGDLLVSVGDPTGGSGPTVATDRVARVPRDDLAPSLPPPSATPPVGTTTTPSTPPTPSTPVAPTPGTPPPTSTQAPDGTRIYLPHAWSG